MLQIKKISKTYQTGDLVQVALDNVSLNLRDSEFVAILGPSGSGKTTLLNIIGGLDQYDSGDLVINNISTKNYKDRDWDSYRNHSVGFVFQSYNLIPHQTILSNVELSLTIGGINKAERKRRALKALDEVGLKDQAHKKPNQLSGGQMQRVAIARALVNNPDIVLADEPTGALDTNTSIQVMELLKEVAKDRLVVMVTHNPDLANDYATRIVRLRDGQITDDSNPFIIDYNEADKASERTLGKAHMSFFTALSLSFNNLLTKKGRTILTAFAGSIGIIGIALILSLSTGFQNYIDKIQEDTLSSYPLTINSETADISSLILSFVSDDGGKGVETGEIVEKPYLSEMFASIGTNDLKSLKSYLDSHKEEYQDYVQRIRYTYTITPLIYTIDAVGQLAKLNPNSMMNMMTSSSNASLMSSVQSSSGMGIFSEIVCDEQELADNYDILAGRLPENYNEMLIVLSEHGSISDLLVYSLGLRDTDELMEMVSDLTNGDKVENNNTPMHLSYDDLLNLDLRLISAVDTYKYNEKYDIYEDMSSDDDYMLDLYDDALRLKVVGVVICKEGGSTLLSPGVAYSQDLIDYIINKAADSEIVQKQLSNKDVDVISGKDFDDVKNENGLNLQDMVKVDENMLKSAFKINADFASAFDQESMQKIVMASTSEVVKKLNTLDQATYAAMITTLDENLASAMIGNYVSNNLNNVTYQLDISATSVNSYKESFFTSLMYENIISNITSSSGMDKTMIESLTRDTLINLFDAFITDARNRSGDGGNSVSIALLDVTNFAKNEIKKNSYQQDIAVKTMTLMTQLSTAYVAQGMGEAISETMAPLSTMFNGDFMTFDTQKFAQAFKFDMSDDQLSRIMESMFNSSGSVSSWKANLTIFGYQDKEEPTNISFYFDTFENKEFFIDYLNAYNERVDEEKEISFTDVTGILMNGVKKIIDSVSYVLISFVSISLVVSSIMIAVITLISVMERTKEIGILRAMGASKHNVSSIFNAETFIIGLLSGLLGVGVTLALIPPINHLIHSLTDNYAINAVLPFEGAVVLILISVILTIFAGIIPSRKAAKQDPVIALRSE